MVKRISTKRIPVEQFAQNGRPQNEMTVRGQELMGMMVVVFFENHIVGWSSTVARRLIGPAAVATGFCASNCNFDLPRKYLSIFYTTIWMEGLTPIFTILKFRLFSSLYTNVFFII